MHIPDGFLSASVAAATWGLSGLAVTVALRAERAAPQAMPAGVLGATAALLFAGQAINLPVAPGVSGHLVGATLAAVLLGPWRGLIAMTVVLGIQAVLFQDGGIAALGANLLDMGVVGVSAGYAVAAATARAGGGPRSLVVGSALGGFVATLAGAVLTGVWLGLSGLYPLGGIVSLLLVTHAAIGVLEAALTGAVVVTLLHWRPDLVGGLGRNQPIAHPAVAGLGLLGVALAFVAFVAPFASGLPDGLEHVARQLGLEHRAHPAGSAPLSDHALWLLGSARLAVAAAGVVGTLLVAGIAWLLSRGIRSGDGVAHR